MRTDFLNEIVSSKKLNPKQVINALNSAEEIIIHKYLVNLDDEFGEIKDVLKDVVSPLYELRKGIEQKLKES